MLNQVLQRLPEVLRAMAPLVGIVCLLQVGVVHSPLAVFLQFLLGSLLVVVGMALLFVGIDLGVLPMGRYIGAELPRRRSIWLIVGVAFGLGFVTTVAEPDVLILGQQVMTASGGEISASGLSYAIAAGVGLFTALALLRIVIGVPFKWLLAGVYGAMLLLSLWAPPAFAPLAYDAGSVTTGVLSAPVLLALALGLASVLAGRSAQVDGFGLLGLASSGPIFVILLLSLGYGR